MNKPRLLAGMLVASLLGGAPCAYGQTSMTLDEIFEIADSHSARLRPSLSAEQEALREISVARSARLPEITASLSVSYIGDGFTTRRGFGDCQKADIPHLGNGLGITVSQPVYTGGAIKNAVEMAGLKSSAARFASDFSRDNLRFRLAGFYLDIYKYHNLRRVVESNIDAAKKVLGEMHARYEQGTALLNDITRYELLVSNLELSLIRIDNTLTILNDNLVVTAGLPEGTVVTPDSTLLDKALPRSGEALWQQEAELNAPSLKIARTGVDISRKAEDLVRSRRLPKIGIQAAWTLDGPILVELPPINRNLSYWYVGIGVSYDISSLFKSNKALAKSRVATQKALEDLDVERENLTLAVRADYIRYLEAGEALRSMEKSVELAERNYRTTATRYSADMALITDMLDAANSRLDAEQQLVNARIDIIYCYYKLLFTSGQI